MTTEDDSISPSQQRKYIAKRRTQLAKAGYLPIPAIGKRTHLNGWSAIAEVTADLIAQWAQDHPDHVSDGLLGKRTPGLDADITNRAASEAVEALVREQFGGRGRILVRTGLPPKRLIPFRTDASFSKFTVNLIAPDGEPGQKIEFLAGGSMFLAFGIHPETRQPYTWRGGEPGRVKRDELPEISEAEAKALVDAVVQMLIRDFGYAVPERTEGASRGGGGGRDWDELIGNIRTGTELHGSIRDLAAKLVGHGVADDACVGFIGDRMDECAADHDARWQARRDDIPRMVQTAREKFGAHGVTLDDFKAYMPTHSYVFVPSRETWVAASVNARLKLVPVIGRDGRPVLDTDGRLVKIKASAWLDQHRAVEQMTWAPGMPMLIADRLISLGGWIDRPDVSCFNLYLPPAISGGDPKKARPWLKHILRVYGKAEVKHAVKWFAHRVQRPHVKINHALMLGGEQGIGKDTILEPVKRAVGPWNFQEVSPQNMMGRFNGFLKSVILRVSETRDLGDANRFQFYDHMKTYTAAPPDVLRVDEKNLREHYVLNCTGVIYTTNKKDSLYLPAEDRRTYVMWSDRTKEDFTEQYWTELWRWYDSGGDKHVAAYLRQLDLTGFNPKAPPPKTEAFWQIVEINRTPENSELADLIDAMGAPSALTLDDLRDQARTAAGTISPGMVAAADLYDWLCDRTKSRAIPHRLEDCGYVSVRNRSRGDGVWQIGPKRHVIYVRRGLSIRDQYQAALDLVAARTPAG